MLRCILFIGFLLSANLSLAQLACGASFLKLTAYEYSPTGGVRITIELSTVDGAVGYAILHRFQLGAEIIEETLPVSDLSLTLSLNPAASLHGFTAFSTCADGTTTEGATFFLDFAGASPNCPPPSNLVIEFVNNLSTGFRWQGNAQADHYEVQYTPQGGATQITETPVPSFVQELLPAVVHTFEIRAVCPAPGIINVTDQYSAAYRFSIVTVDDIKAFRLSCAEMEVIADTAYLLQCTKHGDFGANKDSFLLVHKNICLTAAWELVFQQMTLMPNPANHIVNISYQLLEPSVVSGALFDISGNLVRNWLPQQRQNPGIHYYNIILTDLPRGFYSLRLQARGQTISRKIIKL